MASYALHQLVALGDVLAFGVMCFAVCQLAVAVVRRDLRWR